MEYPDMENIVLIRKLIVDHKKFPHKIASEKVYNTKQIKQFLL